MKNISFFSPEDNQEETRKTRPQFWGNISARGTLVFPADAVAALGIDLDGQYRIGTTDNRKKLKKLYMFPAVADQPGFSFSRIGRGKGFELSRILTAGGIDYSAGSYRFEIQQVSYEETQGFLLSFEPLGPKPAYTGKPRGRKRKEAIL